MSKWYKQGFQDAKDGLCDPPWHPKHRDYRSYMEGHVDGVRELDREAEREQRTVAAYVSEGLGE